MANSTVGWKIITMAVLYISFTKAGEYPCRASTTVTADDVTMLTGPELDHKDFNQRCWEIQTSSSSQVVLLEVLNVTFLSSETIIDPCRQRSLAVYDGDTKEGYEEKGRFCRTRTEPWTYTSNSRCCLMVSLVTEDQSYPPPSSRVQFYIRITPTSKSTSYAMVGYLLGAFGLLLFIMVVLLYRQPCKRCRLASSSLPRSFNSSNNIVTLTNYQNENGRHQHLNGTSDLSQPREGGATTSYQNGGAGPVGGVTTVYDPPPLYSELSVRAEPPDDSAPAPAHEAGSGSAYQEVRSAGSRPDYDDGDSSIPRLDDAGTVQISPSQGGVETNGGQSVDLRGTPTTSRLTTPPTLTSASGNDPSQHRSAQAGHHRVVIPATPPPVYDDMVLTFPEISATASGTDHNSSRDSSVDTDVRTVPSSVRTANIGSEASTVPLPSERSVENPARSETRRPRRHSSSSFPMTPPPMYDESMLFMFPPTPRSSPMNQRSRRSAAGTE